MHRLFIIDVTRGYLPAALLTAAAYMGADGGEAMLVHGSADQKIVRRAVERFHPARILAMAGTTPAIAFGGEELHVESLPADPAPLLSWLIGEVVERARGVVLFPSHSPSWAIKAAALAVRLGYLAWPLEEAAGFAYAAPSGVPVLVLGEAPGAVADTLQGREFRHLPGDRAIAQFLLEQGVPVDYVVLVNSSDLEPPSYSGGSMGASWTQGLSLLAPLLASYRNAMVLDARTPRADSREIERTLNQKVADTGLTPDYLAILASPGAIPFIHEPQHSFSGGEDPTREIHLRLNHDVFFDCAEGRIFGQTAGKVSLQLLKTKHYAALDGGFKDEALILGHPKADSGIAFAIDEALGRAQLKPIFARAGLRTTELYGADCTPGEIARHIGKAGLVIYGGHGSPESLHTHAAPLYVEFLPDRLAPGVVYACACSTMYPKPHRYSSDGGFSFEEEAVPPAEQIGPAFVDRGALAFVGGLTVEDVLLNSAMYVVFAQALALKGYSVGQAVRAARNYSLTHLAVLSQTSPGAFNDYRATLANTIQQQICLGDPAFTPYAANAAARLPQEVVAAEDQVTVQITLPEDRWLRRSVAVAQGPANKEFHKARQFEHWTPVGEDVVNWGQGYPVALDREEQSDKAVMGSYIHLTADLPAGRVPVGLALVSAEAAPAECLLCGTAHPVSPETALERFSTYVVPFIGGQAPVKHDLSKGWAFATEETATGLRIHWMVPALAIDDPARRALLLRSATFVLRHAPGVRAEGRLEMALGSGRKSAPGSVEGTRGQLPDDLLLSFGHLQPLEEGQKKPVLTVIGQALTGPGGRWSCWLPAGAEFGIRLDLALPVYRHAGEAAISYTPDYLGTLRAGSGAVSTPLKAPDPGAIRGHVLDLVTGRPLPGARVRLWRGKNGGKFPVYEGYVGEAKADAHGRFEFTAPAGSYLIQAAHRTDLRYFYGKAAVRVYREKEAPVVLTLEPGAVLTGRLIFDGAYTPKHVGIRLIEHGNKEEKVLASGRTRRDGTFEILAPATRPFDVLIQPEGFVAVRDENGGDGFHLTPGETLQQSWSLTRKA